MVTITNNNNQKIDSIVVKYANNCDGVPWNTPLVTLAVRQFFLIGKYSISGSISHNALYFYFSNLVVVLHAKLFFFTSIIAIAKTIVFFL